MTLTKLIPALLLAISLTACGGGGAKVQSSTTNTTMGQELLDLNESYKKGILSEKEYNYAKENIMERYEQ